MSSPDRRTTVCVAGGGPAGMILGFLLARAGIDVTVLERHHDFLRDFRGDTIHPTTLDLLDDLGMGECVQAIPHSEVTTLDAVVNGVRFRSADFTGVGRSGRLWFMPQWDLLDAIAKQANTFPHFTLLMDTRATEVTWAGDRVTGITAHGPDGEFVITADLTIAADGRDSTLRTSAGLELVETGVAVDVLWFRLDRPAHNPPDTIAYISTDTVITIPRTDYYQCALLIPKGGFDAVQRAGIEEFQRRIARAVPFLEPTVGTVATMDDVKLLDIRIAHSPRWHRPGLMLIGDAAHPMSPAFGVGINYAIQDALATARTLVSAPEIAGLDETVLQSIQRRRERPMRMMQRIQQLIHRTVGRPNHDSSLPPLAVLRFATPIISRLGRRLIGRLVGAGFRPERLDF